MKKYYLLTLQVMMLLFVRGVFAFDDKTTHPAITEAAITKSIIGCDACTYLRDNFGFKRGIGEKIANNPEQPDQQINR